MISWLCGPIDDSTLGHLTDDPERAAAAAAAAAAFPPRAQWAAAATAAVEGAAHARILRGGGGSSDGDNGVLGGLDRGVLGDAAAGASVAAASMTLSEQLFFDLYHGCTSLYAERLILSFGYILAASCVERDSNCGLEGTRTAVSNCGLKLRSRTAAVRCCSAERPAFELLLC